MSVFRPASLNGIATGKNVADYKASAKMELGTIVALDDTTKTFAPSATGEYAIWQYADADANIRGLGTNYTVIEEGTFARLVYLPALVGLKDGVEIGGEVIAETNAIAVGDVLIADTNGKYVKVPAGAATYVVAFKVTDIIEEHDFTRYICEVVANYEVSA